MLDLLWAVAALPLAGFAVLFATGGRLPNGAVTTVALSATGLSADIAMLIEIQLFAAPPPDGVLRHVSPDDPDNPKLRRVRPLHLCVYAYAWYLFTTDLTYNDEKDRTFSVGRMTEAQETDESFELESPVDIDEKLEHCFGIDRRGDPVDIRLRFSAAVRQFIKERHWHKSQQFVFLEDGGIDLLIHVRPTEEVVAFIGSWRKNCKVMEPLSLAQRVRDDLREEVAMYDGLPETPGKES